MAASPETDALLSIGDMSSSPSPPSSPVLPLAQESSSLTTAAPPEPAQLDHTTPTPLPPPEQDTAEHSELGEFPPPKVGGDLAPSPPPPEAALALPSLEAASPEKPASPALEAASLEKPISPPSCPPGAPVKVFSDVSAFAASPPPSPQIGEAPPDDAPPPLSPPPTSPVTTSPLAVLDSSSTEAVAMASHEATSPPPASNLDSHSAPAPLTRPLESGPEGLSLQQHQRPAAPAMTPQVCDNTEPAQPPSRLLAERTDMLSDTAADEVAAGASAEAAGSTPALEVMGGKRDTASDLPAALVSGAEEVSPQQQPLSLDSEIVPPLCQNSEPAELPQLPPPPAESTYCSLEAAVNEVAVVASEESAGPPPALDATGGEAELESWSEGPLQEPMHTSSSTKMEADAGSPDMAPPGFENFKSKWLPQPAHTMPIESTHYLLEAPVTDSAGVMPEAVAGSLPTLETMDVEMDISAGQLPSSRSAENMRLHQSLMVPSSLTIETAPCSPDSPPPGFENFKTSWLPQPTVPPSVETRYLPDVATSKEDLVEKSCSVQALDTMDMETNTARNSLPTSESGAGALLEVPEPCSTDMPPPGFENFKTSWLPQPTVPPSAETTYLPDVATSKEELVEKSCSVQALDTTDMETDTARNSLPTLESGAGALLEVPEPCSTDMPPPGFENFKTSWLPQPIATPSAETTYLPDVATSKEELVEKSCSVPALDKMDMETDTAQNSLPTLGSGAGGLLEVPVPSSPSPGMQPTSCSPYITPPKFESLTLPQLQLPSPVAQTSHKSQDSAATRAVCSASDDAPQPSPVLKAIDVEVDAEPALPTSSESGAWESMQQELLHLPSCSGQGITCSLEIVSSGSENLESLEDAVNTRATREAVGHPLSVAEATEEAKGHILPPQLENGYDGRLTCLEPKASSPVVQAAPSSSGTTPTGFEILESSQQTSPRLAEKIEDSPSHLLFTKSVTVKSEKTAQLLSPLQATDTDMESAPVLQSPLKSNGKPLPHPQHQPSSPSGKDVPCSPDIAPPGYENLNSSEELPPPPPLCPNFEMGQMVCGCCRELIAYPRGATHVQCFGCWTINLVLEAHQVGKVYCGQCEALLMYPFGAPAVRCSNCLFVTEIGERNVRPRVSAEQGTPPHPQEVGQA